MSQTLRVGIFMTVALVVLAYLIFKAEDLDPFGARGERVEAVFESVAGLDDKAPVRVAGVRVGRVDGIRLEGGRAVVGLLLETPVELGSGASARVANLGMLGDKYVDLDPGPEGEPLAAGALIPGSAPVSFDQAISKLSAIGDTMGATLESFEAEGAGASISRLLENLEAASEGLKRLIDANQSQITGTIGNFETFSARLAEELPTLTAQMERVLEQVELVISENRGELKEGLESVGDVAARVRTSIDHLNDISGKIAAGEGTIGKLVNSEETHDELVAALTSVKSGVEDLSDTFGRIRKLKLDLGFDSYYLEKADDFRNEFSLFLDPGSDRFYQIGVVDDSRGQTRSKTEVVTVTGPDGIPATTTTERLTREDKIVFSAQVGYEVGDLRLRAGLFESAGGAGFDYLLFDRRLWLTLEAFDFGREQDLEPHLRLTSKWYLHPNFYLLGGYDDMLESTRETFFLGGGVRWGDDDLKYLLGSIPSF